MPAEPEPAAENPDDPASPAATVATIHGLNRLGHDAAMFEVGVVENTPHLGTDAEEAASATLHQEPTLPPR